MKSISRFWQVSVLVILALLGLVVVAPLGLGSTPTSAYELPESDAGLAGTGPIPRYDWFKKLWLEHRTAWARDVQKDQGAIVFLGDSITGEWKDLTNYFPGLKVANRGISGDTTRGVLIRAGADVLALHPKAVVLLIGINDINAEAPLEGIAENLKGILGEIERQIPRIPIVLCQVFPSSEAQHRPADRIKKLNRLYAAAVKGDSRVTLIETWPLFANANGDAKKEEFPDLLHPNAAGYQKWANALRPIFATLGFMDTEPDAFAPEPGFVSLFNGYNLEGWTYRATSAEDIRSAKHWQQTDPDAAAWPVVTRPLSFDGQTNTFDGRYVAKNGRLIVTTPPEGRKIQALWTTREFSKDFVLKLEFRATPNTDSGVFIRQPQLQCRDYGLAGPYKNLKRYKPQDWNEMVVEVHGGEAHCECNGELLEAALKVPETGPIGLEGDRGQMEYRRIRVRELP